MSRASREERAKELLSSADRRLKDIRKLAAKPEQRRFLVGPKKKVTQMDTLRMRELQRGEQEDRAAGMKLLREKE